MNTITAINSYNPSSISELIPTDSHKSFYGKAKVLNCEGFEVLISYDTAICHKSRGEIVPCCSPDCLSKTTLRHIKSFCGLNKKEFLKLFKD